MTIEIVATINSDGARRGADQLNRALDSSRSRVAGFDRNIVSLNRALGFMGGYLSARALIEFGKSAISAADDFARLEARITALGTGGYSALEVMSAVGDAADRARVPVNDLTDVYARNASALERLGYTQSESIRIAETLAKLGTLSGGSAQSVSAAMFQLSQAFNSGTLRGEEFNSVAEQAPAVLRAVADQLGVNIGELRKFASEGKISADTFAAAILNASAETDDKFGKMSKTVDQSLTQFSNSFATNWGRVSKEMKVTEAWTGAIDELSAAIERPAVQQIFRTFADDLAYVGEAAKGALSYVANLYEQFDAYKRGGGLSFIVREAPIAPVNGFGALAGGAKGLLESNAKIPTFDTNAPPRKVTLGAGTADKSEAERIERTIARVRELSAVEDLRNAVLQAKINGEREVARQLEHQIELEQRITPEMEKHAPLLAEELRQRLENGYELERQLEVQSELIERNKAFADEMASALTTGFKNAITQGNSFTETLRNVASQLTDIVMQATLFDPLQKSLSNSISGSLGSADLGSMFSGFSLGGLGFAKGGVLSSPARFTSGGMQAVAGEAGPEALLPLKRGADGSLGVVAQGGATAAPNIYITITGDATDATVAKMEQVARQIVAQTAPGVVRDSVAAVRREHVRDSNYLRR